jgi:hypothetical protein
LLRFHFVSLRKIWLWLFLPLKNLQNFFKLNHPEPSKYLKDI